MGSAWHQINDAMLIEKRGVFEDKSSCVLVEEFFGFVDLGGKKWTPASVRVIQDDELSMSFADDLFCDAAFTTSSEYT